MPSQKERYDTIYGPRLRAERRAKDFERKNRPCMHPVAILAYTAGIVDGEGCIGVNRRGAKGGQFAAAHQFGQHFMGVWVNSTTKPMIDFLAANWGGSVRMIPEKPTLNRKAQWNWLLQANDALHMLDAIAPYLVVKVRQMRLARRFQRYVQVAGRARTERIYRLQSRFYDEFKQLNHRGLGPPRVRTD